VSLGVTSREIAKHEDRPSEGGHVATIQDFRRVSNPGFQESPERKSPSGFRKSGIRESR
jgi:hypothetical protein